MKKILIILALLVLTLGAGRVFAVDDEGGGSAGTTPATVLPSEVRNFTWTYVPGVDDFVAGDLHVFWQIAFGGIPYAITVTATEGDTITIAWDANGASLTAITVAKGATITAVFSGITVTASTGSYDWLSKSDPDGGGAALPIAVQPVVIVADSTPTITETQTETITPTQTQTITETATPSITQTQTQTITETNTQTITQTVTPTITRTPVAGYMTLNNNQTSGKEFLISGPVKLRGISFSTFAAVPVGKTLYVVNVSKLSEIPDYAADLTGHSTYVTHFYAETFNHSLTWWVGEQVGGKYAYPYLPLG